MQKHDSINVIYNEAHYGVLYIYISLDFLKSNKNDVFWHIGKHVKPVNI